MIENELTKKLREADIPSILKKKGYAFFTNGIYNLNIIAVRKDANNVVTNKYDDALLVMYKTKEGWQKDIYNITTDPGTYYMKEVLGNPKGTAILVPGQYRGAWKLGKHHSKYEALVQDKPVSVYRDGNKDDIFDLSPKKVYTGKFGINIHRSNQWYTRETVDMYSGGCQVFNNPYDFRKFINICKEQAKIFGNHFTYTLLNESDLG